MWRGNRAPLRLFSRQRRFAHAPRLAPHASCAELHAAGECDRAIVKKHCPASCGLCEDPESLERHLELANMYGEMNHRQLKKIC